MEKVRIGVEMATRWTDPTMVLICLLPLILIELSWTGYHVYEFVTAGLAAKLFDGVIPEGDVLNDLLLKAALMFLPYLLTVFVWKVIYHGMGEDKSVDTSLFVIYRDPKLAAFYKHRKIPMCELYEDYINEKCDWNEECEDGDCYKILNLHRNKFVNYKVTYRQIHWLIVQFLPSFMTCGSGLGYGSSSGKSIEETTKEIDEHYNKGNDVFSCILGSAMVYTCGIFHQMPKFASDEYDGDYEASASDGQLEEAQFNKMNMICDKLMLQEGETLLDVGCGWGTLARHAVKEYGAEAVGVTLSREGKIWCDKASKDTGIPTEILHCDYRNIPQERKFDKISCIEMAEHVGLKNFIDPYLVNMRRLMKDKDSKFMMQVAGLRQGSNWEDVAWALWMGKYVFPGADASCPLNWYIRQCERAGFEVHSVETIGIHYSHTLHKWYDNWMSHKEEILSGEIDAISDHSTGAHLFRLNELTWAWAAIHAKQGGGSCYQILMHPCEYEYPRDQWVDGKHVSNGGLTGVGTNSAYNSPASSPKASRKKATKKSAKKSTKKSTKKTPTKKTPTKKTPTKKASTKKRATPKRSAKK